MNSQNLTKLNSVTDTSKKKIFEKPKKQNSSLYWKSP